MAGKGKGEKSQRCQQPQQCGTTEPLVATEPVDAAKSGVVSEFEALEEFEQQRGMAKPANNPGEKAVEEGQEHDPSTNGARVAEACETGVVKEELAESGTPQNTRTSAEGAVVKVQYEVGQDNHEDDTGAEGGTAVVFGGSAYQPATARTTKPLENVVWERVEDDEETETEAGHVEACAKCTQSTLEAERPHLVAAGATTTQWFDLAAGDDTSPLPPPHIWYHVYQQAPSAAGTWLYGGVFRLVPMAQDTGQVYWMGAPGPLFAQPPPFTEDGETAWPPDVVQHGPLFWHDSSPALTSAVGKELIHVDTSYDWPVTTSNKEPPDGGTSQGGEGEDGGMALPLPQPPPDDQPVQTAKKVVEAPQTLRKVGFEFRETAQQPKDPSEGDTQSWSAGHLSEDEVKSQTSDESSGSWDSSADWAEHKAWAEAKCESMLAEARAAVKAARALR